MSADDETALDAVTARQRVRPIVDESITAVGRWYTVSEKNGGWIGCVTRLGTNYAEITSINRDSTRIHFDEFEKICTPIEDIDRVLAENVQKHRAAAAELMAEVRAITARLGLTSAALAPATGELVVASSKQPVHEYKAALVLAEKETLPALFSKIKEENEQMAQWMKASLIPLKAEVDVMHAVVGRIKERIFSVELYAGLIEEVAQLTEGEPAGRTEKVHLFQRRHYMDEECLANYEAGGMDINSIEKFYTWLSKPVNRARILPFPKCIVAFRVRRRDKERNWTSIREFFANMYAAEADKATFLFIRNGDQLYVLRTGIEFDEQLFPDLDRQTYSGKLWCKHFGREIITDAQYKGLQEEDRAVRRKIRATPKKDRWTFGHRAGHEADAYEPVNPTNVYFDDANASIDAEMKKHNRLVLVLQGLLDRSPTLHPHPAWRLWTDVDFKVALELVYDDSRALTPGDAPDFEAYRARCNATLRAGSITIGQHDVWYAREKKKGTTNSYRYYNNPGPAEIGPVSQYIARSKTCVYRWERARSSPKKWRDDPDTFPCSVRVPAARVFNVDAYRLGDIKQFFADPRTRADYLQWAPLLVECEERHAERRKKK